MNRHACFAALISMLMLGTAAAHAREPDQAQQPHDITGWGVRWVDLGHWTWIYYDGWGDSQSGEVAYAPASVLTEKNTRTVVVRDVLIRITWRVDLGRHEYIDRSGVGLKSHALWQLAIACNLNSWGRSWWHWDYTRNTLGEHGPDRGPFPITSDSVPQVLKRIVCP